MHPLSEPARTELVETVRRFQELHADALPKCDDAYGRLYPDQIGLFAFRQVWTDVVGERQRAAAAAAQRAELAAEIRGELQPAAQTPFTAEPPSRGDDAETLSADQASE